MKDANLLQWSGEIKAVSAAIAEMALLADESYENGLICSTLCIQLSNLAISFNKQLKKVSGEICGTTD